MQSHRRTKAPHTRLLEARNLLLMCPLLAATVDDRDRQKPRKEIQNIRKSMVDAQYKKMTWKRRAMRGKPRRRRRAPAMSAGSRLIVMLLFVKNCFAASSAFSFTTSSCASSKRGAEKKGIFLKMLVFNFLGLKIFLA